MLTRMDKKEIESLGARVYRVTWVWTAEWVVIAESPEEVERIAKLQSYRDVGAELDTVSVEDMIDEYENIHRYWEKTGSSVKLEEMVIPEIDAAVIDGDFAEVAEFAARHEAMEALKKPQEEE